MATGIEIKIDPEGLLKNLQKSLQKEAKLSLEVGVLEGAKGVDGGPSMAQIASFIEYGWVQSVTPKQRGYFAGGYGIGLKVGNPLFNPPRPVFRSTFAGNSKKWSQLATNVFTQELSIRKALEVVGKIAQEDLQMTIVNGGNSYADFPKRSPMTMEILKQNAKGHKVKGSKNTTMSDQPLNGTGAFKNSIAYNIREK